MLPDFPSLWQRISRSSGRRGDESAACLSVCVRLFALTLKHRKQAPGGRGWLRGRVREALEARIAFVIRFAVNQSCLVLADVFRSDFPASSQRFISHDLLSSLSLSLSVLSPADNHSLLPHLCGSFRGANRITHSHTHSHSLAGNRAAHVLLFSGSLASADGHLLVHLSACNSLSFLPLLLLPPLLLVH